MRFPPITIILLSILVLVTASPVDTAPDLSIDDPNAVDHHSRAAATHKVEAKEAESKLIEATSEQNARLAKIMRNEHVKFGAHHITKARSAAEHQATVETIKVLPLSHPDASTNHNVTAATYNKRSEALSLESKEALEKFKKGVDVDDAAKNLAHGLWTEAMASKNAKLAASHEVTAKKADHYQKKNILDAIPAFRRVRERPAVSNAKVDKGKRYVKPSARPKRISKLGKK